MNTQNPVWLAASYHFPGTYSCRVPMSSTRSALAMPAPGPATVRLALIRNAIELFGLEYTREEMFSVIRSMDVRIRPPERVALSTQLVREYKASKGKLPDGDGLTECPVYREFAQAIGLMTVYICVPTEFEDALHETLSSIGYWGRSDSLTCCVGVERNSPNPTECATPFGTLRLNHSVQRFFSCVVSEFRDVHLNWDEVTPTAHTERADAIQMQVFVWPMLIIEQHRGGKVLLRRPLDELHRKIAAEHRR